MMLLRSVETYTSSLCASITCACNPASVLAQAVKLRSTIGEKMMNILLKRHLGEQAGALLQQV